LELDAASTGSVWGNETGLAPSFEAYVEVKASRLRRQLSAKVQPGVLLVLPDLSHGSRLRMFATSVSHP
jgi:hypothetical protein